MGILWENINAAEEKKQKDKEKFHFFTSNYILLEGGYYYFMYADTKGLSFRQKSLYTFMLQLTPDAARVGSYFSRLVQISATRNNSCEIELN